MVTRRLCYSSAELDRSSMLRKDSAWVADQLNRAETLIVPVWRDRNLIAGIAGSSPQPSAVTLVRSAATRIVDTATEIVFLGLHNETAVFAADISECEEAHLNELVPLRPDDMAFVDLRSTGALMEPREAGLMAYARGLPHWHRNHRYCGRCGYRSDSQQAGHVRLCSNPDCGREIYPRIDPVVIMLVEYRPPDGGPPRCLLGRHSRLPAGMYSTLAGYVETGESLEEAVIREVFEEAGVHIKSAIYQGSQPWPFSGALMLGFRAQAETTAVSVDRDELADARWFTPEEIRLAGDWGDEAARLRLSRKDSMSRFLVDSWMAELAQVGV